MFLDKNESTKLLKFSSKKDLLEFLNKKDVTNKTRNFVINFWYEPELSCWVCKLTKLDLYLQELKKQGKLKNAN